MGKQKKRFEVQDNESISECLDRMKNEGYTPVRRMEEPVFEEIKENGKLIQKHLRQKIVFEGRKIESNN